MVIPFRVRSDVRRTRLRQRQRTTSASKCLRARWSPTNVSSRPARGPTLSNAQRVRISDATGQAGRTRNVGPGAQRGRMCTPQPKRTARAKRISSAPRKLGTRLQPGKTTTIATGRAVSRSTCASRYTTQIQLDTRSAWASLSECHGHYGSPRSTGCQCWRSYRTSSQASWSTLPRNLAGSLPRLDVASSLEVSPVCRTGPPVAYSLAAVSWWEGRTT
jgi:hypothetical protein